MKTFYRFYKDHGTRFMNFAKPPQFNIFDLELITSLGIVFTGKQTREMSRPLNKFLEGYGKRVYLRYELGSYIDDNFKDKYKTDKDRVTDKVLYKTYRPDVKVKHNKDIIKLKANDLLIQDTGYEHLNYVLNGSLKDVVENKINIRAINKAVSFNLKTMNRDTIIVIDVVKDELLTYENIITNLKSKSPEITLRYNKNFNIYLMYEFFKLLISDYRKKSLLKPLLDMRLDKIHFYFKNGSKGYLVSLALIFDMLKIKESEIDVYRGSDVNELKLLKLFLHNNNLLTVTNSVKVETIKDYMQITQDSSDTDNGDTSANISEDSLIVATKVSTTKVKQVTENKFYSGADAVKDMIKTAISNGEIKESKAEELIKELESNKVTTTNPEEFKIDLKEDIKTTRIKDENLTKDTLRHVDETYIEKHLHKDVKDVVHHLSGVGVVVTDYKTEEIKSVVGDSIKIEFKVKPIKGPATTIPIIIPKVEKDGTYKNAGNTYRLKKQRVDIPIKKISKNTVMLSSPYGKVKIIRGKNKNQQQSHKLVKMLFEMSKDPENKAIKKLISGSCTVYGKSFSPQMELMQEVVSSLYYKGIYFNFNYHNRTDDLQDEDIDQIEKLGTYIGKRGEEYYVVDSDDMILVVTKLGVKKKELGKLFDLLGIDTSKLGYEYVEMELVKNMIPISLILSSWLGLEQFLNHVKISYEVLPAGKRAQEGQIALHLQDTTIMLEDNKINQLLFGGFIKHKKLLRYFTLDMYNSPSSYAEIFNVLGIGSNQANKIGLMLNLFIDPITASVLRDLKEPENMVDLVYRAVEMLQTNEHKHNNDISGTYIRGYERIPSLLYSTLSKALTQHQYKTIFTKSQLRVNPYEVMNLLNSDSTEIVDDINPVAYLKQAAETTATGIGGRSEESMTTPSRIYHPSMVGVISEATKDSKMVAISAGLSFSPILDNVRGVIKNKDNKNLSPYQVYSISALRAPFSLHDDPKRVGFISVQNTHEAPLKSGKALPLRTGIEEILPQRVPDKFCAVAKDYGTVENVTDKNVTIKYKDGTKKKYKLYEWTSKEAAGISYRHHIITNLKKGDKVEPGDAICYDDKFFVQDMFHPKRVIGVWGKTYRIALLEKLTTWEDSFALDTELADDLSIEAATYYSEIVNYKDKIELLVKKNDKIEAGDVMLVKAGSEADLQGVKMDDKTIKSLTHLAKTHMKSHLSGKLFKIKVFYNCEKSELSPSLKKLLELTDESESGRVTSGYSVNGRKLMEGDVEIKFYFQKDMPIGVVDKVILASQAKCTLGEPFNYKVYDENGNRVNGLFSTNSTEARNISSAFLQGAYMNGLDIIRKKIIEAYKK